jgi:aminoglycoside phosphotransferase (APT) family kinase protein
MNPSEGTFHTPAPSPEKTHGEMKHERWNTSTETLQKILLKVSESPITESHKITLGESNEVFSVTTEDNTEYIVRIFHGEDTKFEKEQWVIEECRKVGIPVPEVLLIDSIMVDSKPLEVSVLSKLPGIPLNQIPNITTPEAQAELITLLHQIGEILAKIHSIEMRGYGRINKEHHGQHETIEDLLGEVKAYLEKIITPALLHKLEDLEAVKIAFEILKRESTTLQTSSPRLIHNDFAPAHILINEGMTSMENLTL